MSRILPICGMVAFLGLGMPRLASADPLVVGNIIRLYDSFGTTNGGEFNAQIVGTTSAFDFITFCLEINEYFTPGQNLRVAGVTGGAMNGGAGGAVGGSDPLDPRTAYLYTQFSLQTLSNFAFGSTGAARVADANSLQRAVWYLEQELGAIDTLAELNALDQQAALWVQEAAAAGWTSTGDVFVLNLYRRDSQGNYTVRAQDQLYYYHVPEPGSLMLVSAGLLALLASRRRLIA